MGLSLKEIKKLNKEKRFWAFVNQTNDCWIWISHLDRNGYGLIKWKHTNILAHRFSYELHNGEIPSGMFICHKCDNPSCVNPLHLYAGTAKTNAEDRTLRGRSDNRAGENNTQAKLTKEEVFAIRKEFSEGTTVIDLVLKYGMSKNHIYNLCRRGSELWTGKRKNVRPTK